MALIAPLLTAEEIVVRVPVDEAQLMALRVAFDVWTYSPALGEATVLLDDVDRDRLAAMGLSWRRDESATRDLENWRLTFERIAARGSTEDANQGDRGSGIPGFSCYRTVEETYSDLEALALAHPNLAVWSDLGDSWEKDSGTSTGYDVRVLVVSNHLNPAPKAPFVLLAATHARELVTAETATRFAETLVNGFGIDPDITALLDAVAVHIVPIHNPDGRKLAEAGQMRRKNTRTGTCGNPLQTGVDLNRNASTFWDPSGGTTIAGCTTDTFPSNGSSGDVCSELYRGASAASEPETLAIEDYFPMVFTDQRGEAATAAAPDATEGLFISLHSSGGLVLYPWEAIHCDPPNHDQLRTLGRKFGHYLSGFAVCQDCLGTAAGTNVDEAYGRYGVASYTIELGNKFFQGCTGEGLNFEDDIWPETREALLYAAKAARRPYQEPRGPEVIDVPSLGGTVMAGAQVAVSGTADDTRFATGAGGDTAPEPIETVAAVYTTIDVPPWNAGSLSPLSASDGFFNESTEAFGGTIDSTGLSSGRHLVYIVAEDSTGQRGVPTVRFLDVIGDDVFADGFESGGVGAWSGIFP